MQPLLRSLIAIFIICVVSYLSISLAQRFPVIYQRKKPIERQLIHDKPSSTSKLDPSPSPANISKFIQLNESLKKIEEKSPDSTKVQVTTGKVNFDYQIKLKSFYTFDYRMLTTEFTLR